MLPNQITVTLVVIMLGLIAMASLAISGVLIYQGTDTLGEVVVISSYGTTALGGLIGLLGGTAVRNGTHTKNGDTQNV